MGPNIKIQKTGAEVTAKPNFWPASDLGVIRIQQAVDRKPQHGTERQYHAGMKRKYQRTLELIFSRPVSGSLPWRDIEALFQQLGGDVSERAGRNTE